MPNDATLENFDQENPPVRFGTPRSNEACDLIGIEPRELRRRPESDFRNEEFAELVYERHTKKVDKMLKEARKERDKIKDEDDDELDFSRTMEEDRKRQAKIDAEFESKRRAIEIRLQKDLEAQKKVAIKNENIQRAKQQRKDCLNLEKKKQLNAKKLAQAQYAKEKASKDKEERQRKESERQNLQSKNLSELDMKNKEDDKKRKEAANLRAQRFRAKSEEVENQRHYKGEVKKIQNLKKQKQQRLRDKERQIAHEKKKKEHFLIEQEAKERNERLKRAKQHKDKRKMDKEKKKAERMKEKKRLADQLRQQAIQQQNLLNDDLKKEKEYIEQTCMDVRNWGLGQVQSQMNIINKWKVKGNKTGSSTRSRFTKSKANKSDGVLLPPLPSSPKNKVKGGSAKLSPRPPAAARV